MKLLSAIKNNDSIITKGHLDSVLNNNSTNNINLTYDKITDSLTSTDSANKISISRAELIKMFPFLSNGNSNAIQSNEIQGDLVVSGNIVSKKYIVSKKDVISLGSLNEDEYATNITFENNEVTLNFKNSEPEVIRIGV